MRLSNVRTFLLWALAIVWFTEMALWGVRPLAEVWTRFWQQLPPEDSRLTAALYITHAFEAAAKGALGVLAVFALRSNSPSVRSALFVPMALVPPLNLAFQFRMQGFPVGPTTVGTVLSTILWGSFFLFKDGQETGPAVTERVDWSARSRWDSFQGAWFGANAAILTIVASLFLLAPETGLRSTFPCLSGLLDSSRPVPSGLTSSLMAVGTHLMAVSIATWIAASSSRGDSTVRQAVAAASAVQAGVLCVLPLREMAVELGPGCARSSLITYAIPLFVSWALYATLAHRAVAARQRSQERPASG